MRQFLYFSLILEGFFFNSVNKFFFHFHLCTKCYFKFGPKNLFLLVFHEILNMSKNILLYDVWFCKNIFVYIDWKKLKIKGPDLTLWLKQRMFLLLKNMPFQKLFFPSNYVKFLFSPFSLKIIYSNPKLYFIRISEFLLTKKN
jgi:hypothetical protein